MGVPRAFRTDNGTEYSNSMLVDFCNDLGIRREFTAPYTPQHSRPVESAISQASKAVHAARLGVPQLYPDICLGEVRGCIDAAGTSLWLESLLWASDRYNRAATSVNEEWLSPHERFYGSRPRLLLLLFLQLAYRRVPRQRKTDPQAGMRCFIKFVYNHGRGCYRLLDAETGRVAYSGDVIWHHPSSGTTQKHRGSHRSGMRHQNRREIFTSPCRSLCRLPRHLLHPSPLRQLTHRQRHYRHRLHQRRTLQLRSPHALAAN